VLAGLETDLLIGAGCVSEVVTTYVGAEAIETIGPFFRMKGERNEIAVREVDESLYWAALKAGGSKLPFMPSRSGVGTSLPEINPYLKPFHDPIKGEPLIAVPAISPDVALIHVGAADVYGNAFNLGPVYGDKGLWKASQKTILEAERIVPNETIRARAAETFVFGANAVVRAPFGAHPFAMPGYYLEDREHLKEYVVAAKKAASGERRLFDQYLEKYIYDTEGHLDYLETVGLRRLLSLHEY
jgi:glutaconate CoA-transferase subunit A